MNRRLFHLIGYAAPVCLLPYLLTLPAGGGMRERFPLLFFAVAGLGLAGVFGGEPPGDVFLRRRGTTASDFNSYANTPVALSFEKKNNHSI